MAWPPVIPPTGRTNDTPTKDAHPSDHNVTAQALTDLVTKVQANSDALVAVVPWITLPLASPWVPYGSGYQAPQYRMVGDRVEFRGVANRGTAVAVPTAITTALPAAYRPPAKVQLAGVFGNILATIEVASDGVLNIVGVASGTTLSYFVFYGITSYSVTP